MLTNSYKIESAYGKKSNKKKTTITTYNSIYHLKPYVKGVQTDEIARLLQQFLVQIY